MASREELHSLLKNILGSSNVYYQSPSNVKMVYPAIRYKLNDVYKVPADDVAYMKKRQYLLTVIDKEPDNPVIDKILELPMSSFVRAYPADNLSHTVLSLYY